MDKKDEEILRLRQDIRRLEDWNYLLRKQVEDKDKALAHWRAEFDKVQEKLRAFGYGKAVFDEKGEEKEKG